MNQLPISSIRLDPNSRLGLVQQARRTYLHSLDVDRLLYMFRATAGLPTRGAEPMTGWDAPDCLLRGHTTGHAMSALALDYAATGDETAHAMLDDLIDGLVEVRDAFAKLPGFRTGFLSAYDESQFDDLERFVPYPRIWAPYYTLHKLLAGLLDAYDLTGSAPALDLAKGIGLWTVRRLRRLSETQLRRMWGMYIAGEFGGLNESLVVLAERLTTRPERPAAQPERPQTAPPERIGEADDGLAHDLIYAARLFDNDRLLAPLLRGDDELDGMHANQHIPQVIGWVRLYEATGQRRYLDAARQFWKEMTGSHLYVFGGTGRGEMLHAPNVIAGELGDETAESCATYNMVKLAHRLRLHDGDRMDREDCMDRKDCEDCMNCMNCMDYVELATRNHLLASVCPRPDGGSTYFLPTTPGGCKTFDLDGNTCCHGTGMETPFRFCEGMALYDGATSTLHITQYLPTTIDDPTTGIRMTIHGSDANPGHVAIDIRRLPADTLRLRIPWWTHGWATVMLNDVTLRIDCDDANHELVLDHHALAQAGLTSWTGAHIDLMFRPRFTVTPTPDDPSVVSVAWGPYVLAALGGMRGHDVPADGIAPADDDVPAADTGVSDATEASGTTEESSTNTNAHDIPPVDVDQLLPIHISPTDIGAAGHADADFARVGRGLEWVHRSSGIRFKPIGLIDDGQPYHLYLRLE